MIRPQNIDDLLILLNTVDELDDIEAKEISGTTVGRSVYETICSLSNEPDLEGGTILLGVSKENALFPLYSVKGITNPDKICSEIASTCGTIFNQSIRVMIKAIKCRGKIVIKIDVPELPKAHKPVYFKATGLPRGAYRRVGPTDVKCTDEDLAIFYQAGPGDPFDARIMRDVTWRDIDSDAIQAYRNARQKINSAAEELKWTDEELLYSLGCAKRVDENLRFTNAGLLLFGKSASIRRIFPSHRIDYIRVPGKNWIDDPEGGFDSLDMRGPIINLISRVIAAISDDLPRTFLIEDNSSGQRTETPVLPFRVIRESVVNAIMHRSYQFHQPIQFIRFANRLVIKNSGYSLKSPDRFGEPGSSIRNPNIAAVLHETNFAETKGSGIKIMKAKMAQRGLASPTFESNRDTDEFAATFLFHHFLNEADLDWLATFRDFDLTEDQMKCLIFVREVGAIDNSTYRNLNSTDTLQASKNLRALRKLELLADKGSSTRTHYIPGREMVAREHVERKRGHGAGTIQDSGAILDGTIQDSAKYLQNMPISLRLAVRSAQATRRLKPSEAQDIIAAICKWKAMSIAEIANILDKNPTYIGQRYVNPMAKQGILLYTKPEMVQHPDQKYKTKE